MTKTPQDQTNELPVTDSAQGQEREHDRAELAAVGSDSGSSPTETASSSYSGSYNGNQLRESHERVVRENRVLNEALRALLYCGGMGRDQTPCPVCLWPLPVDIDHHICECCGCHHSYNDEASYDWDGEFWALDHDAHAPKIIKLLYARIAALQKLLAATKASTEPRPSPNSKTLSTLDAQGRYLHIPPRPSGDTMTIRVRIERAGRALITHCRGPRSAYDSAYHAAAREALLIAKERLEQRYANFRAGLPEASYDIGWGDGIDVSVTDVENLIAELSDGNQEKDHNASLLPGDALASPATTETLPVCHCCPEFGPGNYHCTMYRGHIGYHIATGTSGNVYVTWPQIGSVSDSSTAERAVAPRRSEAQKSDSHT